MSYKPDRKYDRVRLITALTMDPDKKYMDSTYTVHLKRVSDIMDKYHVYDEDIKIAFWLANCKLPFRKRIDMFGRRATRFAYSYRKYQLGNTKVKLANEVITMFLCERIANTEYCIDEGRDDIFNFYSKGYEDFRREFYKQSHHKEMWSYLDFAYRKVKTFNNTCFYL